MIDMTEDAPFEKKWRPILPYEKRVPASKQNPDAKYNWTYDKRPLSMELFLGIEEQAYFYEDEILKAKT